MGVQRVTRNRGTMGSLQVGTGGTLKKIVHGTVANVNPASIAAGGVGSVALTITGVAGGDVVMVEPPAALEAGLLAGLPVISANTVTIPLANPTGDAIDGAARTWRYTWIDLT